MPPKDGENCKFILLGVTGGEIHNFTLRFEKTIDPRNLMVPWILYTCSLSVILFHFESKHVHFVISGWYVKHWPKMKYWRWRQYKSYWCFPSHLLAPGEYNYINIYIMCAPIFELYNSLLELKTSTATTVNGSGGHSAY